MKIIYLIAATYRPAGMERVLAMKAEWLRDHRLEDCAYRPGSNEVVIITSDQKGRPSVFGLEKFRQTDLGINYEETNGRNFLVKSVCYLWKHFRHRRRLACVLKAEKADIVISMFNNDVDLVPYIKDGSRKLLEVHFSRFKKLQYARKGLWALADRWRTRCDARYAARFDCFVTLTKEDMACWQEDFQALGLKPEVCCIPNPRALEFSEVSNLSAHQVMAAGRITHQKGFDLLLDAWRKMDSDGWTLRIVGAGDRLTGVPENVIVGPSDDIRSEYLKSSVFVLSSRYEGFGLVLTEAQAAGLPMVSFACKSGPSEIITEGEDGFLVEPENTEALAEKLSLLMHDEALRRSMGRAARRNSERFAIEVIMPQWAALLRGSGRKTIVLSAVNLRKGGTLTILRQYLSEMSRRANAENLRVVALVHKRKLCDYLGIEYVEMPWCIKSWAHRLWAEYVTMKGISRRLAAENGTPDKPEPVDLWLSLHDTTPNVIAKRQEVYCHTSFPFLKIKWRDWYMDPKIPIFALMGRVYFRINVHRNAAVIVQQRWFAEAMGRMLNIPAEKFRVEAPSFDMGAAGGTRQSPDKEAVPTFLYASTPDCHKNFETLCEAAKRLEDEIGRGRFKVTLTVRGDENRYARWLLRKWGTVASLDFHGFMTKQELYDAYRTSDCLVFPSRIETWGLPISEFIELNPEGQLLLADLPYAHETSGGRGRYFPVTDVATLRNLMYESIAAR